MHDGGPQGCNSLTFHEPFLKQHKRGRASLLLSVCGESPGQIFSS